MAVVPCDERLTLPLAGVALNQLAPLMDALQFSLCTQVPPAAIVTAWVAGLGWPTTPAKVRAAGVPAMVQGGARVKFTGMTCGLPTTVCPLLSTPLIVTMPV